MKSIKGVVAVACGLALSLGLAGCSSSKEGNSMAVSKNGEEFLEVDMTDPDKAIEEMREFIYGDRDDKDLDMVDVLAERDKFIEDQQLEVGSQLKAKTPKQKEFINTQGSFIKEEGYEMTDDLEHIYLVVALEGCETSILNNHKVNPSVVRNHLLTDPTLREISENPTPLSDEDKDLMYQKMNEVAAFGMTYLCPDDALAWANASESVFPLFSKSN